MAVQLPPFQELTDIPTVAQRHRCAIRALTITSIVLVFLLLFLAVPTSVALVSSYSNEFYGFNVALILFGIPLLIMVIFLVLLSSIISLRNTDKWVPADACCNLMRSQPACCTKSCGGNKHCCARLSSVHIATSVFSSLLLVLFVVAFITGCVPSDNTYTDYVKPKPRRPAYYCEEIRTPDYRLYDGGRKLQGTYTTTTTLQGTYTTSHEAFKVDCWNLKTEGQCRDYPSQCVWKTYWVENTDRTPTATTQCPILAIFDVPTIILLICLVATTARSAWLVRAIEQEQAEIAVLPPNKMVTQSVAGNAMMMQRTVVGHVCVVDEEEPKTETGTEQNV